MRTQDTDSEQINFVDSMYTSLFTEKVAKYINEQINKQKSMSKKETMTCTRSIYIAQYNHNHLGLCHKHFAIAPKITISGIEAGFAVLYLLFLLSVICDCAAFLLNNKKKTN